ncbi:unnamed protein product [Onchocerca flexuosa]|uniref:PDZ domain-containing protein n=1 Tax=Onchocerca flexuosa TaxID=387005 RepID=A0A183HF60_9BILA|nr:unnamed protein product [Onchocerca flexuosa]
MKYEDDLLSNVDEEEISNISSNSYNTNLTSDDGRPTSQSRRKQDLSTIRENNDEVMIMHCSNDKASVPKDLSEIPVYLTETQRDLFFSFIRPASPSSASPSSTHKWMQSGDIITNISGDSNAVRHLRIIRLRSHYADVNYFSLPTCEFICNTNTVINCILHKEVQATSCHV